jgi:hypothetical protein
MKILITKSDNVFFIESLDNTVLVALNLMYKDGYVTWFDTVRDRFIKCKEVLENTPEKFVISRDPLEADFTYLFRPIELKDYQNNFKLFISGRKIDSLEVLKTELRKNIY